MRLAWIVWNIHDDWQALEATTFEQAAVELQRHMPYSEEAKVKDLDTGQVWNWRPPRDDIHWGP